MSESLKYYPKAIVIEGKLGTQGAGELKPIVDGKTLRMLNQAKAPGITQRPNTHLRALKAANTRANEIYPMGSGRSRRVGSLQAASRG